MTDSDDSLRTRLRDPIQATLGTSCLLDRELAGGGMSRVFVARDETLGRDVVIKVISQRTRKD